MNRKAFVFMSPEYYGINHGHAFNLSPDTFRSTRITVTVGWEPVTTRAVKAHMIGPIHQVVEV